MNEKLFYNGQPVTEIIKRRTSVRTYRNEPLQDSVKKELISCFQGIKGPFDASVRFMLIDNKMKDESLKLGTYGVIKNAPAFIMAAVEKKGMYMEQLGYEFEKAVLYATSLSLGTCWMAGTFKKSEFSKAAGLKENEELPIVSPVGYPEDNRRLLDKFMRFAAGSDNRKGSSELFFNGDFGKALEGGEAGKYAQPLEMVRLAPSASNKQPWRIVKEGRHFHFYLQHTKGYGSSLGFDVQKVDMGIAMCHFELSSKGLGLEGSWVTKKSEVGNIPEEAEYIISWEAVS